jgi:acetyl esterase/lipase
MLYSYDQIDNIPYYEADMPKHGNLDYLQERCKLDIYYPLNAKFSPTILFFHGGGLSAGGKFIPETLKNSRVIVVSANYRLSGDRARCPDYLNDAAAAAAWVFRHIAEYGGDPELVFVSGGSGGAYLAAMIGMAPPFLAQFGESNRRFAALMPISGQMSTHFQIVNERNGTVGMQQPPRMTVDEYAPLYHASAELSPIMLYAGDPKIEWPTRAEENALLAATLTRVAGHTATELYLFPGFNHGNVYEPAYVLMRERVFLEMGRRLRPRVKPAPLRVGRGVCRMPLQARLGGPEPFGTEVCWSHDGKDLIVRVECPEKQMDQLVIAPLVYEGDCIEIWFKSATDVYAFYGMSPDGRLLYCDYGMREGAVRSSATCHDGGWSVEFRKPLAELPASAGINVIRRHMAGGDDTYTNWSPIYSGVNREDEAFVELKVDFDG